MNRKTVKYLILVEAVVLKHLQKTLKDKIERIKEHEG